MIRSQRGPFLRPFGIAAGLGLTALFGLFPVASAQAYLDPGSGTMILQVVIGAIAGGMVAIKVYWERLRGFFSAKGGETPKRR